MSRTAIGLLFILAGTAYGSLAFNSINKKTIGYLTKRNWIKAPKEPENKDNFDLNPKVSIILYSLLSISLGIYLLWSQKI